MNASMSRRAALMDVVAIPAAVALPAIAEAVPASLLLNDDSPRAALARAEQAIDCFRTRYIRSGWSVDTDECERALGYFRRAAAAGKWADSDDVPDEQFAFDFLYRHGQSLDWVFRGDVAGMVCQLASLSDPAA